MSSSPFAEESCEYAVQPVRKLELIMRLTRPAVGVGRFQHLEHLYPWEVGVWG